MPGAQRPVGRHPREVVHRPSIRPPGPARACAVEEVRHLLEARAGKPGQAYDLVLAERRTRHRAQPLPTGRRRDGGGVTRGPCGVERRARRARRRRSASRGRRQSAPAASTVPALRPSRSTVIRSGDGQRRVQVVRDEEDARARRRDVPDEREQIVALVPRQVGRRLIEHEQARRRCRRVPSAPPRPGRWRPARVAPVAGRRLLAAGSTAIPKRPRIACARRRSAGQEMNQRLRMWPGLSSRRFSATLRGGDQTEVLVDEAHAELGRPRGLQRRRDRLARRPRARQPESGAW